TKGHIGDIPKLAAMGRIRNGGAVSLGGGGEHAGEVGVEHGDVAKFGIKLVFQETFAFVNNVAITGPVEEIELESGLGVEIRSGNLPDIIFKPAERIGGGERVILEGSGQRIVIDRAKIKRRAGCIHLASLIVFHRLYLIRQVEMAEQ